MLLVQGDRGPRIMEAAQSMNESDAPPDQRQGHGMRPKTPSSPLPLLSVRSIHKRFGGTYALQDVSFDVHAGEVVALLGENGAGKSTLIKILAGVHDRDAGEIRFDGSLVGRRVAGLPIAFIHQDLGLIDWMTVAENVALTRGFERSRGLISWRRCRQTAQRALQQIGVMVDPDTRIRSLSRTECSLVAIARAITMSARIIVMDEPTASLPADEVERLFDAVRLLRAQGVAILYVSHRLEEIFEIADRVVVLRDGRLVGDRTVRGTTPDALVRLIIGTEVGAVARTPVASTHRRTWEIVEGVAEGVGPVSLSVRPGEVLGLTGLRGAGQESIGRAMFGLVPFTEGELLIEGKSVRVRDPVSSIAKGVRFASGDRRGESIVPGFSVSENLFLNPCAAGQSAFSLIRPRLEGQGARRIGQFLRLSPNDPRMPADQLSGGNQQKVVLGRWLHLKGRLLVLEDPTAGVDVGAKGDIYRLLFEALETGLSIVVVSTDFVEVAAICHRALVFSRGRIVAAIDASELTAEALLSAAAVTASTPGQNQPTKRRIEDGSFASF